MMRSRWTMAAVCALGLLGCSKPQYIQESVPLTQDMSAYGSANVEVTVPEGMTNPGALQTGIKDGLSNQLRQQNVVAKTDVPEPDILVKVAVVDVDRGSDVNRAVAGSGGLVGLNSALNNNGEGSITLQVEVTDVKKAARLASFSAMGVSGEAGDPKLSLGGVNTAVLTDVTDLSMAFAAKEIARYLKTRKPVAE